MFIRFSRDLYSWYCGSLASPGCLKLPENCISDILGLLRFQASRDRYSLASTEVSAWFHFSQGP